MPTDIAYLAGPTIATAKIMHYLDLQIGPEAPYRQQRAAKTIEDLVNERLVRAMHPNACPYILFLDVDGVLFDNPFDETVKQIAQRLFPDCKGIGNYEYQIASATLFSKEAVDNLDTLISSVESVAIVISSSWRENRQVSQLRNEMFSTHNFSKYIIDKTPELFAGRLAEILQYLKEHPSIKQFAILDDWDCGLSDVFEENFIKVDDQKLLTKDNVTKALRIFNVKPVNNKKVAYETRVTAEHGDKVTTVFNPVYSPKPSKGQQTANNDCCILM